MNDKPPFTGLTHSLCNKFIYLFITIFEDAICEILTSQMENH